MTTKCRECEELVEAVDARGFCEDCRDDAIDVQDPEELILSMAQNPWACVRTLEAAERDGWYGLEAGLSASGWAKLLNDATITAEQSVGLARETFAATRWLDAMRLMSAVAQLTGSADQNHDTDREKPWLTTYYVTAPVWDTEIARAHLGSSSRGVAITIRTDEDVETLRQKLADGLYLTITEASELLARLGIRR